MAIERRELKKREYTPSATGRLFHLSGKKIKGIRGPVGCLPPETEIMTPSGWLRISEWSGQEILQWDPEGGKAYFRKPEEYVKGASEGFIEMCCGDHLTMVLSEAHRMALYDWCGRFVVKTAGEVAAHPSKHTVPTTWEPESEGVGMTDDEMRLWVATAADGYYPKIGKRCVFCFRRKRKVARLLEILDRLGIERDVVVRDRLDGSKETVITFDRLAFPKHLDWRLARVTRSQAEVVIGEVRYWDGLYDSGYDRFDTSCERDADIIQYVAHCAGRNATKRASRDSRGDRWAEMYSVNPARIGSAKNKVMVRCDGLKTRRVESSDGNQYCFVTNTGFFVARHEGSIFVTGNSGKSVACCLEVFMKACGQRANAKGVRESKWLFYRRHAVDLELTTLETWLEWFPETQMKRDSPMTGYLTVPHPSGDGTRVDIHLIFMGLETGEDIKKLKSLELSGAWGNEATQIDWKIHSTVYERLGRFPRKCDGVEYPRLGLLMDTNAPHESNWWKKRAEDVRDANERYFAQPPALLREWVEMGDGRKGWVYEWNCGQREGVLPAENVENHNEGFEYWMNMVRTKDEDDIRTQVLNEYGLSVEGLPIYPEWKDGWHFRGKDVVFEPGRLLVVGMDFGRTPAAVLMQMGRDGQVRVLEEVVSQDMGIKQFCEEMLIPVLTEGYRYGSGVRVVCYADPAGANPNEVDSVSQIEMVNACGLECWPCDVPGNSFVLRSNCVKDLLRGVRDGKPAVALSEKCKTLKDGFNGGYCYKKMAGGILGEERYAPGPDKSSFYTHVQDAFQYGVWSLIKGNRYSGGLMEGGNAGGSLLAAQMPKSRLRMAM